MVKNLGSRKTSASPIYTGCESTHLSANASFLLYICSRHSRQVRVTTDESTHVCCSRGTQKGKDIPIYRLWFTFLIPNRSLSRKQAVFRIRPTTFYEQLQPIFVVEKLIIASTPDILCLLWYLYVGSVHTFLLTKHFSIIIWSAPGSLKWSGPWEPFDTYNLCIEKKITVQAVTLLFKMKLWKFFNVSWNQIWEMCTMKLVFTVRRRCVPGKIWQTKMD